MMSNARMLMVLFLTQPDQAIYIRATPISVVDLNLRLPN